ncbi:MAG: ABC transporter ATP-binding protein [Candidatus Aminicenantes bacterium]|nr:ABC transporter ATP-binding protein [Candidatus Aminicenantes bacterium]
MADFLTVDSLNKSFDGIVALENFSCKIKKKGILGLIGPNGAGKSTFFNVLTGFITCDSGKTNFMGTEITGKSADKIARMGISRTFQDLRLIRQIRVLDNILLCFRDQPGEKLRNTFIKNSLVRKKEKENKKKAVALLEYAGIADKAGSLANDLSYGQQKLLSITCCLAADADLLLLDEPVSGLNPVMIEKILSIISELPEKGKSVILIEHNMEAIMQISDRIIFMDTGKKISEGTPQEVRSDPRIIEAYLD